MSKATERQWRVQVRRWHDSDWENKGLFETREAARKKARELREPRITGQMLEPGYSFGNTRVVKYQKK